MRIGLGFDVHRFEKGLPLILGGVQIPYEKGLKGHSDADVLLHAICDALLGAVSLGDIGVHFPDNSDEFKGIDSKILLDRTAEMIRNENYEIVNVDTVLILQKPKIKNYILQMREQIATVLSVDISCVSVKATTSEGLGFTGRGEGIAAKSVVLLKER